MSTGEMRMRFEARELSPGAVPVVAHGLQVGETYFSVQFIDEEMFVPTIEPLVFVGRNLAPFDRHTVYFQDAESHRQGVRFDSGAERGVFSAQGEDEINHIFEFEHALNLILVCSIRRRERR
jgi:hypothetical protein